MSGETERNPSRDCPRCARLVAFRNAQRALHREWFNAPVPSFGDFGGQLLIVGLAPGLKGANRTGRPFTGDYAGDLLYGTLSDFGFSEGVFAADPDDGLELVNCMITNAVRCVPPQNKPVGSEMQNCRPFLQATIAAMVNLRAIVALGRVAHENTLSALNARRADFPFAHGAAHSIGALCLFDSFHCSRYNTNTGRLTAEMFQDVFREVRAHLDR